MRRVNINFPRRVLCLVLSVLFLAACSSSKRPAAEAIPSAQSTPISDTPTAANHQSPPNLKAVEEAVSRVFKDAATVDTDHKPAFVAGDFNGDQSQDIAIVIKPSAERIAQLNEEFPNWILRDPRGPVERSPRLKVGADDTLLAIIHGYGANGWRDPEATQTYLLKNVVGSAMQVHSATESKSVPEGKKVPTLKGDVISEVIEGQGGYLYFTTSTYGWYDPKTFTGEPELRRGHGGAARRTN